MGISGVLTMPERPSETVDSLVSRTEQNRVSSLFPAESPASQVLKIIEDKRLTTHPFFGTFYSGMEHYAFGRPDNFDTAVRNFLTIMGSRELPTPLHQVVHNFTGIMIPLTLNERYQMHYDIGNYGRGFYPT